MRKEIETGITRLSLERQNWLAVRNSIGALYSRAAPDCQGMRGENPLNCELFQRVLRVA
jgi:hypothetical protein